MLTWQAICTYCEPSELGWIRLSQAANGMSIASTSARAFLPESGRIQDLRAAARVCRGCALYRRATQTVFGEGRPGAALMLIGEAPGDEEDRRGRPFVGPAGKLLRETLDVLEIDPRDVYVTNVVKHFKWEPRGKRRLHAKPKGREVAACRPWLDAEIEAIQAATLVCLGATAAQALIGRDFRVTRARGEVQRIAGLPPIVPTHHPSAILRAPDPEDRHRMRDELRHDLQTAQRAALKTIH
jgi:uracil-DNA glycosylase